MNFRKIQSNIVFLFILFWGYSNTTISQTLTSELFSKLPASDQKKLQKASELDSKGKSIEEEAARILSSGDQNTDQDKTTKKYYQKLIEASQCYRDGNSIRYKVYDSNIKTFWKNYKGDKQGLNSANSVETSAVDSFKKATEFRFMAEKSRQSQEKLALIAQAKRFENKSLEMLQKVLYIYLNWPVEYIPEWLVADNLDLPSAYKKQVGSEASLSHVNITNLDTVDSENDSSLYSMVRVNEEQIDMFNDFLKKTYPTDFESYLINFARLQFSDIESIRAAWYAYLYHEVPSDSMQMLANMQDSASLSTADLTDNTAQPSTSSQYGSKTKKPAKKTSTSTEYLTDNTVQPSTSSKYDSKSKKSKKGVSKQDLADSGTNEAALTSSESQQVYEKGTVSGKVKPEKIILPGKVVAYKAGTTTNAANSLFTFRVQIAACRVKIDEQILREIYNGVEDIQELYEDNWYKYSIGEYTSYLDARNLRNQLQIPGAFVTAYLRGKHINATPFHPNKRTFGAKIARGMDPALIEFRLQIAACRVPLSQQFLQNIYNGEIIIDNIYEEGWYKYSLLAGKTIKEAIRLLKKVPVPGVFIVAYHQNIKLDLNEAIRFTKRFNK